jgi:tryptophanyl-tRNA synthetase
MFNANLVPVGDDQVPVIEQTVELVRNFNKLYGKTLVEPKPLLSQIPRLPGTDGKNKMSKSLNNAIYLSDNNDIVAKKVEMMFTDPNHIRAEDPGTIEGNTVFTYLEAFDPDKSGLDDLKMRYRRGGVGDRAVKHRLIEILQEFLEPIRQRRAMYAGSSTEVMRILKNGTDEAYEVAAQTLARVRKAMKIDYF